LKVNEFCQILKENGFGLYLGVPCSILKDVINRLAADAAVKYIPTTGEKEALGIATGAYLGGQKSVVLMQNSGLGDSIEALASLVLLYRIPMLLIISWRGYRGKDAPEHLIMGRSMLKLLRSLDLPYMILPKRNGARVLSVAIQAMEKRGGPVAVIVRSGVVE
jgi:sulfopyruvate decarboxylase alpha subunit